MVIRLYRWTSILNSKMSSVPTPPPPTGSSTTSPPMSSTSSIALDISAIAHVEGDSHSNVESSSKGMSYGQPSNASTAITASPVKDPLQPASVVVSDPAILYRYPHDADPPPMEVHMHTYIHVYYIIFYSILSFFLCLVIMLYSIQPLPHLYLSVLHKQCINITLHGNAMMYNTGV